MVLVYGAVSIQLFAGVVSGLLVWLATTSRACHDVIFSDAYSHHHTLLAQRNKTVGCRCRRPRVCVYVPGEGDINAVVCLIMCDDHTL